MENQQNDAIKSIEGSKRQFVTVDGHYYVLLTIPRWVSHRMSFYRIIREITGINNKFIRQLSTKHHFIALERRSHDKHILVQESTKIFHLSKYIKREYKTNATGKKQTATENDGGGNQKNNALNF